jgi:hypothetical protein
MFDRERALPILNAMQVMYSVIKTDDAQQRTWFTKDEILTLAPPPAKVAAFGIDRYAACHNALAPHRLSLLYRFLVFALNKTS